MLIFVSLLLFTIGVVCTTLLLFAFMIYEVHRSTKNKWPLKEDCLDYRQAFWKNYLPSILLDQIPVLWIVFLLTVLSGISGSLLMSTVYPELWIPFFDWLINYLITGVL